MLALARFIPAGAGNTLPLSALLARNNGLSPLARGTPFLALFPFLLRRLSPAGAGNTSAENRSIAPTSVYPRWWHINVIDYN
ncbi:hypothetical protein ACLB1S_24135 [Escherichia coli]